MGIRNGGNMKGKEPTRKECKKELLVLLDEATCNLGTTDYELFAEKVIEWINKK